MLFVFAEIFDLKTFFLQKTTFLLPTVLDKMLQTKDTRKQLFKRDPKAWIAELVAHRLGTMEVGGSNPGKGECLFLTQI